MDYPSNRVARSNWLATLTAQLTVAAGVMVLTGWAFDIALLKSILPDWVSMKANTAACFTLIGIALWLTTHLSTTPDPQRAALLSRLAAGISALVGLICLLTLCEYLFGWNPGLDQLLFVEPAGTVGTANPGRMAPETALCFMLLAVALFFIGAQRKTHLSVTAAAAGLVVGSLAIAAILSYATPVLGPYGWFGLTIMAMHTAILFTLLGMSVLALCSRIGALVWVLSRNVTTAFLCCIALLAVIGLNTSRSQFQLKEMGRQINYSENVKANTHNVVIGVLQTQTHVRGYVITGDDRIKANCLAAIARSNEYLEFLRKLVADHPHQQRVFDQIETPARAILLWFGKEIDARQSGMGADQLNAMVLQGGDLLKNLVDTGNQIDISHGQRIAQLQLVADKVADTSYFILFAGTLSTLLIFLVTVFRLNGVEIESRQAQTRLKLSEANLGITLHSIGDAVIATDPSGRVTRMNATAERLSGWALTDAMGRPLTDVFRIVNDSTRETAPDPVQRVIAQGQIVGLANHTLLLSRDGKEYPIADSAAPIRNAGGDIVGVVLVFSDFTERYRAEAALRNSEQRYRSLLDNLLTAVVVHRPDTSIMFSNPMAATLLGLTQDQMQGRAALDPAWCFLQDDGTPMPLKDYPVNRVIACREPLRNHVVGVRHPDRSEPTWVLCNAYPVHDAAGNIDQVVVTFVDITERMQQAAQRLLVSQRMEVLLKFHTDAEGRSETEFLQYGLDQVEALTGSQIGFVHFVNKDQETIELLTWSHSTMNGYCTATVDRHYPISQAGVWADALRLRAPVLINDYANAPGKHGLPEGHAHLERLISVPVIEGGLVRMMLGVGNKPQPYTELDMETTRLVGESLWHIASQRRIEAALLKSQQSLNEAQFIAGIGNYALKFSIGLWESSNELDQIFGIDADYERSVQGWTELVHPDDRVMMAEYLQSEVIGQRKLFNKEYRIQRHNDKEMRWVHGLGVLEFDIQGQLLQMHGTIQDITSRKVTESQLQDLAFSDRLTGLPNRRLLMDRLQQAITVSVRHQRRAALLMIDLDDFKSVNDSKGHDKGDLLLQQVAKFLSACVRDGDTVARVGGDEFIVLLEGLSASTPQAATQAEALSDKMLKALNQTYVLAGYEHHSTASIGITLFGEQLEGVEEPLRRSELAMYQAKAAGRNTQRFFDPNMQAVVTARSALEAALREALLKKQFLLYYQAQVNDQQQITGMEALVRWFDPKRGLVSPAEFIPLAEETGLILPLGEWVMEAACTQLALWAKEPALSHLTVAVNVSARQFHQDNFVDQVLAVLAFTGANPRRLKLELTESLLVTNVEAVIAKMNAVKGKGVSFSLDDFGTGYSSLSYLKRLPLNQLKIDQSFVRNILTDANDASIAKMVIALAHSMGLAVMAEGVETEAQRSFLAGLGCHDYQGYLFSRPLPLAEFEAFALRMRTWAV